MHCKTQFSAKYIYLKYRAVILFDPYYRFTQIHGQEVSWVVSRKELMAHAKDVLEDMNPSNGTIH